MDQEDTPARPGAAVKTGGRSDLLACAAIAAVFAIGVAWTGPMANVPVIDDWVYAWSVEHLLKTGRLQVLDISAIYPVTQILWGALFASIAGFSFGALRLSTVALSVLGCWAFYLTLGELGCRPRARLLGALALALHPVYFALSFSFMTDAPFVSLSMVALFFYVSAIRRGETSRLWIGASLSVATFLIRPIALALPLAVLPALDWRAGRRRLVADLLPLGVALASMSVLLVAMRHSLGSLDGEGMRAEYLEWWWLVKPVNYLKWNIGLLFESVFPLLPLLLASLVGRFKVARAGALAAALVLGLRASLGAVPSPLPDWQTWSLQDIGARAMIGGHVLPSPWSLAIAPELALLGTLAVAAALIAGRHASLVVWRSNRPARILLALGVLHLGLINVLWLYNDRYYLVLAPTVAYLAASTLGETMREVSVAAALLALWAVVGLSGTADMLAVNAASAKAEQQLEASGVPPWQIDAGYAWNGWRLYAHPENLQPGGDRHRDVPFVNSDRSTPFVIANLPIAGFDVVSVLPLARASWQASDSLYVLRRQPEPSTTTSGPPGR